MKKKSQKANSGVTLIEVMVVTAILSVFSTFLVSLLMTSQNAWLIENTSVPVRAEAKRTVETIVKELREGDPTAPGGITIGGPNNSQITFSVPDQVSQTKILSWRQVQFSHNSVTQEVTRTEKGNDTVLGRNVTSLQFSLANNVITTTIGAQKTIPGGTATIQSILTSQIKLRN